MAFLFRRKKHKSQKMVEEPQVYIDYRAVAATDVGSVRDNNEDNLVFIRPYDKEKRRDKGCLALVADGMGGHSNGEVASHMATELIPRNYFDSRLGVLEALKQAFEKSNKAIYQKASKSDSSKSMGTTCTAVVLLQDRVYLGHVGDSRAYLLKGNKLEQLSSDHTYVQHLLDKGMISRDEALSHPQRNIITSAIGTNTKLHADYGLQDVKFETGDKLLLCSDGLYEYLSPEELKQIIGQYSLNDAAQSLIQMAKKRGGHDNISVLIVEAVPAESEEINKETQKLNMS